MSPKPSRGADRRSDPAARIPPALARRVWIENIQPCVDDGRFPIKRTVGESVRVTADIFADGHDLLAAVLRHRPLSAAEWRETPMTPLGNDVWEAEFTIEALETHLYTISAWVDRFRSWQDGLSKKSAAGQDVAIELHEGAEHLRAAAARAAGAERALLAETAAYLTSAAPLAERVGRACAADLVALMARHPDRSQASDADRELEVAVARERARSGAWYEMFPRSSGSDPARGGSFRDAEARLPAIAEMGFDVLYLPPIHPIGRTQRKGPDNRPEAAVHPDLGTLVDFDHFHAAVKASGMELALDFALQCSPDHPYLRKHPEWFRHRPDGSIMHAENPPKTYEDIVPLDFSCAAWESLWLEMRRVLFFWMDHGVRIFRVDNPHTKTLRFWGWLIAAAKAVHPETIFLAEAFTRPKVMYALAKAGFDQSYTYFTWRNTKPELIGYLAELTSPPVREFLRPNFFANTPDILPEFLQFGGRAGFLIRLVLAATLGPSYGIYSGFEYAEAEALPGTEEYRDSEKYAIRQRPPSPANGLRAYITRINTIRRENPALVTNAHLRFHPVDNPQLLFFSKTTADLSNIVFVVVNLDPHHTHDGWVEVPTEGFGIGSRDIYQVHDLIGEGRYLWQGARNYVRLDPTASPAQIFRVRRRVRTERDFDYFM
jgi:starch synthase (maltosyl-transferring)